jgi:hypothetical protein
VNDYADMWKVRTTIMQGETEADKIVMEAECMDYLEPLNDDLQGGMAIVLSNWDNMDGRSDFEREDAPAPVGCENSTWALWGLDIMIDGQNNDDHNDDTDDVAEWKPFIGYVEEWSG